MDDRGTTGTGLQGDTLTQGISPFDEKAGVAVWQTSRFPRNELPSFTVMSVNEVIGARTVIARTTRSIKVTHRMIKL
jgi:hypothetical protein